MAYIPPLFFDGRETKEGVEIGKFFLFSLPMLWFISCVSWVGF